MTQPPFSGNDFFDQIDSVARNLTGNAFRLKKNDPTAPQKFTEFVAQSEQEFGQQPQQQAPPQSFTDFEQAGFQQPTELDMVNAAAEARIADSREQQPTFAGNEGAPGPAGMALQALANITSFGGGQFSSITGAGPQEFKDALAAERAFINSVPANNPFERFAQSIESDLFAPSKAFRQTTGDYPQIGVTQEFVDEAGNVLSSALPIAGIPLDVLTPDPTDPQQNQFHIGTGDLLEAVTDPLNFLGPGSFALKGAGSRVVTGAGKKALSAADEAAAAVGRTGVGNVLDPVPPQTVAGRAAGGAGDAISSGRLFQSGFGATYLDDFEKGMRTVPLPQGVSESERLTGQQFVAAMRKTPRELSDLELASVYEEAGRIANDPMQGAIGEQVLSRLNPVISERVASGNLARAEGTSILRGYRLTEKSTKTVGATRQADAAARGAGVEPTFSTLNDGELGARTRSERIADIASGKQEKNYSEDIEVFADRIFREQSPDEARVALLGGDSTVLAAIPTANTPNLALGQGTNKGVLIEYTTEGLKGRPDLHSKPGLRFVAQESGEVELEIRNISNSELGRRAVSVTIDPKVADKRELRLLQRSLNNSGRFDREVLPDGKIRYTPKQTVAPTTPATGTTAGARGAGDVPTARTIKFIRNPEKAPDVGTRFGQDVEPSGRYVTEATDSDIERIHVDHPMARFESGEVTFETPLEIPFGEGYESANNWKRVLSERYQATGKELSQKIADDGYDGIITTLPDGTTGEIVDLTSFKQAPTTPATGTAAARQVTPQQQAIIDDVGTGALPADDVAVDALDVAPVARAADDASLRAIEDATPLGESARDARAAETTYTPESMTIGDDARRVFGADQTIDFKLTTKERATNRLREVLPPDSSKPGSTLGPDADPIVDRLWEEHTKINQRAINLGRTISARVTPRIKKVFKLDDNDRIPSLAGIDPEIPNAPTIQDVAARLPRYFDSMTPEQQQLIRELEVQFKPFGDALRASGDEFGTRIDIIDGGFYIRRGGAENGDQATRFRGRGGRGTKPSFERTAKFPSMAQALDDGWEYDRLGDAINGYVEVSGRRVADNFFTDAMKGVRNEAGERLGLTAKEVLQRDNPEIIDRFAALTKASTKLKNLLKSKDSQLFKNLERLLADPEFDDIEAVRKAFSNSRTVLRGELKGKNIAEVRKALTDLQKELRTFKPKYEAAKKRILAGRAGGDEKRIGLSIYAQLDGITFPERMAARAEELINSTDLRAFSDKKLRYADDINRVYKSVNATADNSAIGIQMLPAIYDNPWRQRRSVIASLMAWAHPDTYSDAVTQFNKRATNSGRVTSDDWAGKYGLAQVSGDANAQDVTSGLLEKGLGIPVVKKPLGSFFKRADAAFNTGGDMARLEMADDMLSEELARGRTLKELHSSGDMRRIANEASAATGYVEGKFAVENLIMFSARFFQARLLTLLRAARGLDIDAPLDLLPVVGNKLRQTGKVPTINRYSRIQDRYARRMILRTLGWGTMLTVLLNEIQGQSTDFNLMKDGKYNSNFIRFRAFGKDRSMFGPLDTMLRIFVNLSTGQAKQTVETFAQSPLASSFLDLFENEDFTGAPIFDPKGTKLEQALQMLEYQATQTVPFALGEAADSIGRIIEGAKNSNPIKVGIGTLDFLSDHIGLKSSPLSSAELRELLTITSDPAIRADIQRELDERKARFRRFDKPRRISGDPDPAFN